MNWKRDLIRAGVVASLFWVAFVATRSHLYSPCWGWLFVPEEFIQLRVQGIWTIDYHYHYVRQSLGYCEIGRMRMYTLLSIAQATSVPILLFLAGLVGVRISRGSKRG